jgi:hypothetical protein
MNTNTESLYDYVLQQIGAESYFKGLDPRTASMVDVTARLRLGTNRTGYPPGERTGNTALNEGYPGYARMTNQQASEFLSKFAIVHQ